MKNTTEVQDQLEIAPHKAAMVKDQPTMVDQPAMKDRAEMGTSPLKQGGK